MSREYLTPEFVSSVNIANYILLERRPRVPQPVDALFFHTRAPGDHTGLFEMAGDIYEAGLVNFIALPNSEGQRVGGVVPGESSPGITWMTKNLVEGQQVPPDRCIPTAEIKDLHTRNENSAFLELSMLSGWRSAAILTQPHQALRAILGMVRVMNESGYLMEVYTVSPLNTPWDEVVRGSQGLQEKPRENHIMDEIDRIPVYQQKGDLASFEELFEYLQVRERGSLRLRNLHPKIRAFIDS